MKYFNNNFSLDETERLCQLYQNCQLSILEEMELEYVLTYCEFDSTMIEETRELMAISRSVNLAKAKALRKPVWVWVMRLTASVTILLGTFAVFRQINFNVVNDDCIVYVSGERASDKVAHEIAEADVVKMRHFLQVVYEQKATEEAKVEQFINHINQSK